VLDLALFVSHEARPSNSPTTQTQYLPDKLFGRSGKLHLTATAKYMHQVHIYITCRYGTPDAGPLIFRRADFTSSEFLDSTFHGLPVLTLSASTALYGNGRPRSLCCVGSCYGNVVSNAVTTCWFMWHNCRLFDIGMSLLLAADRTHIEQEGRSVARANLDPARFSYPSSRRGQSPTTRQQMHPLLAAVNKPDSAGTSRTKAYLRKLLRAVGAELLAMHPRWPWLPRPVAEKDLVPTTV